MKRMVLDASVLLKLFFEEEHSEDAERWIKRADELLAPDLIWVEAANVIWKRQRRGDIDEDAATTLAEGMLTLPLEIYPSAELVPDALELAMRFGRTVCDGLYLALAVRTHSVMVTADQRLVNALADTPIENHIAWIAQKKRG